MLLFAPLTLAIAVGGPAASSLVSVVRDVDGGIPLDSARFETGGKTVLRGLFEEDVRIDAVSLGDGTFSREDGTLHPAAAIRASVRGADGWAMLSDEAIAAGTSPVRILSARNFSPAPETILDAMSGLSVGGLIAVDGSADVRIDVFLPSGVRDNKAGEGDRTPEALVVCPVPTGPIRIQAIVAGDPDDPVLAQVISLGDDGGAPVDAVGATVSPEAIDAGRSGLAILFRGRDAGLTIAMVGLDLDGLGASDGEAIGFRIEIPKGTSLQFKVFGVGTALLDVLASESDPAMLGMLAAGGWGGYSGRGISDGRGGLGTPALPPFQLPWIGGGGGFYGGGGGGGGAPRNPPVIPAPGVAAALLAAFAWRDRRRT